MSELPHRRGVQRSRAFRRCATCWHYMCPDGDCASCPQCRRQEPAPTPQRDPDGTETTAAA
jgi:hypothetical protein